MPNYRNARHRDRTRPRTHDPPVPHPGGRYSRHCLTVTPGPPPKFHDGRECAQSWWSMM